METHVLWVPFFPWASARSLGVEVGPVTDDARGGGSGGDAAARQPSPLEKATRTPARRISVCSCCSGRSGLPLSEPTRPAAPLPGASESDSRAWPGPVGAAGHRAQEGREPEVIPDPGMLRPPPTCGRTGVSPPG